MEYVRGALLDVLMTEQFQIGDLIPAAIAVAVPLAHFADYARPMGRWIGTATP